MAQKLKMAPCLGSEPSYPTFFAVMPPKFAFFGIFIGNLGSLMPAGRFQGVPAPCEALHIYRLAPLLMEGQSQEFVERSLP